MNVITSRGSLVLAALLSFACAAQAEEADTDSVLTLRCSYLDLKTLQLESASIEQGATTEIQGAGSFTFSPSSARQPDVLFNIEAGQASECVFPSGRRVKVKVGRGTARPYGECGGDPEVFASVWVDGRKVLSRYQFSGRCRKYKERPAVFSLKVSSSGVQQCQSLPPSPRSESGGSDAAPSPASPMLQACVQYPPVERFPVDTREYTPRGAKAQNTGDVVVVKGRDRVCGHVADAIREEASPWPPYDLRLLNRPVMTAQSDDLPKPLTGGIEGEFDFNNDGRLDRVILQSFENHFMHGTVMSVQLGGSSTALEVSSQPLDDRSMYLPCDIDGRHHDVQSCPPFDNRNQGDFSITANDGKALYFPGRYARLQPFRFENKTYVDVTSTAVESENYVAVFKPLPDRSFLPVCLLHKLPENF